MKVFYYLNRLVIFLRNNYQAKLTPNAYAKRIGVKLGSDVKFYGITPGMFGSEPWLITLGDNVHITGDVQFINHDGGTLILRHLEPTLEITKPITVGNNVFIGMRTILLPGVNVGNNVIIAAGSVVASDLPDNGVYGGVPAKRLKGLDDYFSKIKLESLGIGDLCAAEKEKELKRMFGITR
ncbi:acyltransferase [Pseudoalteromonas piscicida]|uniref:acyltransferase n=1 Tax=Pseudoalteromonas piscicida TaxID=43662 RepID=UPI001D0B4ECB|nr:acyltransferase [Pseudoalteromonas piscicida]UDM62779.1 acyltransferase [Pseudoalteromonas piscicida]